MVNKRQENSEIHLFVIWSKGRYAETDILNDIKTKFEIIQTFSITWSPYMVHKNFTRFYDTKLPPNSQKEIYAGAGEFKLIVIRDNQPRYDYRVTSKGKFLVNTNMFDAKALYREKTGGGHKIHGTNDIEEVKHDIVMLLGLSLYDFIKKYDKKNQDRSDIILAQDLPGTNGWNSFEEIFYVLNECVEYIVLRNSESVSLEYFQRNKGDIDLLVKNRTRCQYVLGDLNCIDSETKEDSKILVKDTFIFFELYEANNHLFDEHYESFLFENRRLKGNIYCLHKELEFYTMLYHALLFHRNLSDKHKKRIESYIQQNKILEGINIDKESLSFALHEFLRKNDFQFVAPKDHTIYFNFSLLKSQGLPYKGYAIARRLKQFSLRIIEVQRYPKYTRLCFFSFLSNQLELVIRFRFRFFIREIRIALGNIRKYKY